MINSKSFAPLIAILAFGVSACAQDVPPPLPPAMREISPGIFVLGKLQLDQKALTVTFPGSLNMNSGSLEYLLVTPEGSAHESLLITDIQPNDLHFAMLLLGAKGSGLAVPAASDAPPPQIDSTYLKNAPKLKGDSVFISVKWKAGDTEKSAPVEDWLITSETKKPAARGPWTYTGSMFSGDQFLAQNEGCFAALVTNPAALINNPRKGNDSDAAWTVNEKAVPPLKTPVEITIQLTADPKPSKPQKP